jgi:hypothetical protein
MGIAALSFFLFFLLNISSAQTVSQQAKLTASDAAAEDAFGSSVSIDGDYAIVGAHLEDAGGTDAGAAYVFIRSGTSWSQQAKLTASDATAEDAFGSSVSIDGDYAIVGASLKNAAAGAAYVFIRSGTSWSQQAKLTASDAGADDMFGKSISIDGEYAIVGAEFDDDGGTDAGAAYVFVRSGTSWSQQAKLTVSDGEVEDFFGFSVSIDGNYAIVGAESDDNGASDQGVAYVFIRSGTSWSQQAKLTASDAEAEDFFGHSVSIDGDYAIVGAREEDAGGTNSGTAYVFVRSGTSWSQQAKLTASDAEAEDFFGHSVSIDGDYAIVGAYAEDTGGTDAGAVYVFVRSGTSWSQQAKLTASDAEAEDRFGWAGALSDGAVSIDGEYAIVGAQLEDAGGTNAGAAYTYYTDRTAPTISSVTSSTSDGSFKIGDEINITLNFSEAVTLSGGNLNINLETGDTDRQVTISSISSANSASGTYTVQSGDVSTDLSVNTIALSAGTLSDDASNNMSSFSIPSGSNLADNSTIVVDGVVPTVSSVSASTTDGTYTAGDTIAVTIAFSESVTVTGTPQVTLETGSTDAVVDYSSGSGGATLAFNYTVASGHTSSDLDYAGTSSLGLNSGTIKDGAGNDATLTLPSPGASGSLGANKAFVIDAIVPVAEISPSNGSIDVAVASNITISFSEAVRKTDDTILEDNNVDAVVTLKDADANGTDIPFDATINDAKTVITVDPSDSFLSEQTIYVAIGSGVLEDLADNSVGGASVTFITEDIIPPSPFDLVYPFNDTTVILTRDNFLDTLYFAWNQSVDTGGDEVTYKREMTGDLPEYIRFIVPGDGIFDSRGVKSHSLSFDGVDDYVSVTNNLAGSYTAFTISTWVKVDDYGDNDPDFILDVGTSGNGRRINLSISTNGFNASLEGVGSNIFDVYASSSNTTDWQHVVFNWSGTDYARIFINGTQAAETTDISSGTLTLESGDSFNIGKRFSGAHYFPGDIDEMSIWNEALTSSEITALYNTGAGLDASSNSGNYTSSSNLIAYWKMDEGTGTTLSDATSNGNDGTINGATWSPDSPIMSFKTIVGNMYKVPYHHIEHYMHEAGVELISGTWTIVATDGKFDTYATNGPFTLTIDGSKLNIEDGDIIPESFALHANYPNPFNPTTTISYDLPEQSQITLGIYDILGKQIKTLINQSQDAGSKIAIWDGTDNLGRQVSAGVYLYQIQAGAFTQTRKMLLLK